MWVLVTGGMGYIGSNFVRMLLRYRPTWTIVDVDLLMYDVNPENLPGAVELNVRDWIPVEDHCPGVLASLEKGRAGEGYDFGGASERANIDGVRHIIRIAGAFLDQIEYVTGRPRHDRPYAIDFSKARAELGWSPSRTFEEGLAATVSWYREKSEWWQRLREGAYLESSRMISSWSETPAGAMV